MKPSALENAKEKPPALVSIRKPRFPVMSSGARASPEYPDAGRSKSTGFATAYKPALAKKSIP
jgi:hypothetical protein